MRLCHKAGISYCDASFLSGPNRCSAGNCLVSWQPSFINVLGMTDLWERPRWTLEELSFPAAPGIPGGYPGEAGGNSWVKRCCLTHPAAIAALTRTGFSKRGQPLFQFYSAGQTSEHALVILQDGSSPGIISSGFPKASTGLSGVGRGCGGSRSMGCWWTVTGLLTGGFGRTV